MMQSHRFGERTPEEIQAATAALAALRKFRERLAERVPPKAEFFEPNFKLDIESRKTPARRLKYFNQTSLAQSLLLRHEFTIKLLCSIDGYLVAVENKNAILTFLSGRYVLELLATLHSIVADLKKAKEANLRDWDGRGRRFLRELYRARFGSSDPRVAEHLSKTGISKGALDPINIGKAISALSERPEFSSASRDYDYLSNVCHHNGSSHHLFQASMRETTEVCPPNYVAIRTPEPSTAVTLEFPALVAFDSGLVQTVQMVLAASHWVETLLAEMPLLPFTDEEVGQLTNGQVRNSVNFFVPGPKVPPENVLRRPTAKVGRNAPCPCGSGKKYKQCCLV